MNYLYWNTLYEKHKILFIFIALFIFAFFSSYVTFSDASVIRKNSFSFFSGLMIALAGIYVGYRLIHPKKKK